MDAIMNTDAIAALAGLAVAMTWTPGPNNVMLAASGANFGWRRTVPHAMGVSFGFPVMLFIIAMCYFSFRWSQRILAIEV